MSGPTELYEEYESVDLTEDEQCSEEISSDSSVPFNFVDCATTKEFISSSLPGPPLPPLPMLTPIRKMMPSECTNYKNLAPNILKKQETITSVGTTPQGKVCQSKSRPSTLEEAQDILNENSCKKKDAARTSSNVGIPSGVPDLQNISIRHQVTPNAQTQPGKVVIIKKNNKYYKIVIPHNVMPNINKSTGPVLINIPEVGPLVISNDPQVTKSNSISLNQPFSLNLDDVSQNQPKPTPVAKNVKKVQQLSAKEAALCNKKFCWTYIKGRKRDLEGFSATDRLGFNQTDCVKAKRCVRTLHSIIHKKRTELVDHMREFDTFRNSIDKTSSKVKLIKINEIVGKVPKERGIPTGKFKQNESLSPSAPRNSKKNIATTEANSSDLQSVHFPANEVEENYDTDLLLTKRVVILNDGVKSSGVRKRIGQRKQLTRRKQRGRNMGIKQVQVKKFAQRRKFFTDIKLKLVKPCYVHMIRDENVEKAYRKFKRDKQFNSKQTAKVNFDYKTKEKQRVNSNIAHLKTPIASKNIVNQINTNAKYLKSNIIRSEAQFKVEINCFKPCLIINEYNRELVNYSGQFAKNNIVYIVKENGRFPLSVLKDDKFLSAFELGYLKLVDAQLFCKYVMNSEAFKPNEDFSNDHSYCMLKKKHVETGF